MIEDARVNLRTHGDAWGLALADFIEMEIRLYHDSPDRALVLGQQAARQFDALDDDWGRSAVRLHLGFGLRLAGRTQEAGEVLDEAVAISRETGLPNNLARSLAELGELALYTGDAEEAERWFHESDDIVNDLADDTMQALVASGRGDAARYRREPAAALGHYDNALMLYRRSGVLRGVARALTGLAAAQLDLGGRARARQRLDESVPLAREVADPAIMQRLWNNSHVCRHATGATMRLDGCSRKRKGFALDTDVRVAPSQSGMFNSVTVHWRV